MFQISLCLIYLCLCLPMDAICMHLSRRFANPTKIKAFVSSQLSLSNCNRTTNWQSGTDIHQARTRCKWLHRLCSLNFFPDFRRSDGQHNVEMVCTSRLYGLSTTQRSTARFALPDCWFDDSNDWCILSVIKTVSQSIICLIASSYWIRATSRDVTMQNYPVASPLCFIAHTVTFYEHVIQSDEHVIQSDLITRPFMTFSSPYRSTQLRILQSDLHVAFPIFNFSSLQTSMPVSYSFYISNLLFIDWTDPLQWCIMNDQQIWSWMINHMQTYHSPLHLLIDHSPIQLSNHLK